MSSPGIRPQNNKPAAGPAGKKGPPQTLRVLSEEGAARAAAPSIAMPRAKTELSELLAGDEMLYVRRRAPAITARQNANLGSGCTRRGSATPGRSGGRALWPRPRTRIHRCGHTLRAGTLPG